MKIPRVLSVRLLIFSLLAISILCAADLSLGTWRLNVTKSRFDPGPPFKSETRSYEQDRDGVKVSIQAVDSKGISSSSIYLITSDGKQHPVSGSGGPADAVALKQIDELTAESSLMHGGKEIAKTTRVVSADGKIMTITYKGLDPRGTPVNNTLVFERIK